MLEIISYNEFSNSTRKQPTTIPIIEKIKTIIVLFGANLSFGKTTGLMTVKIGVFFLTSIAIFSLFNANSL